MDSASPSDHPLFSSDDSDQEQDQDRGLKISDEIRKYIDKLVYSPGRPKRLTRKKRTASMSASSSDSDGQLRVLEFKSTNRATSRKRPKRRRQSASLSRTQSNVETIAKDTSSRPVRNKGNNRTTAVVVLVENIFGLITEHNGYFEEEGICLSVTNLEEYKQRLSLSKDSTRKERSKDFTKCLEAGSNSTSASEGSFDPETSHKQYGKDSEYIPDMENGDHAQSETSLESDQSWKIVKHKRSISPSSDEIYTSYSIEEDSEGEILLRERNRTRKSTRINKQKTYSMRQHHFRTNSDHSPSEASTSNHVGRKRRGRLRSGDHISDSEQHTEDDTLDVVSNVRDKNGRFTRRSSSKKKSPRSLPSLKNLRGEYPQSPSKASVVEDSSSDVTDEEGGSRNVMPGVSILSRKILSSSEGEESTALRVPRRKTLSRSTTEARGEEDTPGTPDIDEADETQSNASDEFEMFVTKTRTQFKTSLRKNPESRGRHQPTAFSIENNDMSKSALEHGDSKELDKSSEEGAFIPRSASRKRNVARQRTKSSATETASSQCKAVSLRTRQVKYSFKFNVF